MKIVTICLLLASLVALDATAGMFGSDRQDYAANADALNEKIEKEYTIHGDGSVDYRLYRRTRIITYLGKKLNGDIKISYNSAWEKVTVNLTRTATIKADGTRVPVSENEINDIQNPATSGASIFSSARQRVINFPSVEPGDSVEAEITVRTSRPGMKAFYKREYFALQAPTAEKRVVVHLPGKLPLFWASNSRMIEVKRIQQERGVTWTWRGERLPRSVDEPMSPPEMLKSPALFISTLPDYESVARFFCSIIPLDQGLTGSVPDDILNIKSGEIDPVEAADRLYVRFMSRYRPYRIDLFNTSLEPVSPGYTIAQGYGTPLQLANLFRALLEQSGIKSTLCAVSDICDVSLLPLPYMPDLFGTFCLRVKGSWYSFENRELGPGVTGLDGRVAVELDTGRRVIVRDRVKGLDTTMLYMQSGHDEVINGTLYSMTAGDNAASIRRAFRYLSEPELAIAESMILHSVNPLAQGTVTMFGLDSPASPMGIQVKFKIDQPPPALERRTFFPIPAASMLQGFVRLSEHRKNPVWFAEDQRECLELCLKLPLGATVEYLPESLKGRVGPFSWNISVSRHGSMVYYLRELEKRRGMLGKGSDYEQFLRVVRRLSNPSQGVVIAARSLRSP